jgi:hypothetical protein
MLEFSSKKCLLARPTMYWKMRWYDIMGPNVHTFHLVF